MGWAKYDEDNREAMEERWVARDSYSSGSVVTYGSTYNWNKPSANRYPTSAYFRQSTPYTYRSMR